MSLPSTGSRRWWPRLEFVRPDRDGASAPNDAFGESARGRRWSAPFSGVSLRRRLTFVYSLMLFTMLSSFSLGIYWYVGNGRMDELVRDSEARAEQISSDLNRARQSMVDLDRLVGRLNIGPEVTYSLYESGVLDEVFNPFLTPGVGLRIFDRKHNLIFPPEQPDANMVSGLAALPNREQVLSTVPNRLAIVMGLRGNRHREVVTGAAGDQVLVYTVPMYQQSSARAHPAGLGVQNEVIGAIQVLTSLKPYNDTMDTLRRILVLGTLLATAMAALTGAAMAQTAIAPIHRIANTAERINRAQDLDRRIEVDCARDELGHLSVAINDMLDRIESMFNRQRTFLADVSHELRTPLTTIRGEVELMQRTGHVDDEALTAVRDESERMSRMIDDLLLLARADVETEANGNREPVALDQLVMDVYHQGQMMARSNGGHEVHLGEVDAVVVGGERDRIKQLLLNLVANALKHTPGGTNVTLELFHEGDAARLIVRDDGPGIPAEDVPHVFERFYRVGQGPLASQRWHGPRLGHRALHRARPRRRRRGRLSLGRRHLLHRHTAPWPTRKPSMPERSVPPAPSPAPDLLFPRPAQPRVAPPTASTTPSPSPALAPTPVPAPAPSPSPAPEVGARRSRLLTMAGVAGALMLASMFVGGAAGAASALWWLDTQVPTVGPELGGGLIAERAAMRADAQTREEDLVVAAVRATRPAVVTIWNLQHVRQRRFGPVTLSPAASGSGVIFDERGYIATNQHVVANAKAIEVIFLDGRRVKAKVVGGNAEVDVAILSVDPEVEVELPAVAPLADSSTLEPGMRVMAIGSPLGTEYQNTVTNGIIAGLNRRVRERGFNFFSLRAFEYDLNASPLIQTDAAINTGNSGGPLVNLDGRVVGLNTLIVRRNGSSEVEGLGFAVPSNVVRALAAEWIDGHVRGVPDFGFEAVTPEIARQLHLNRAAGVLVDELPAGSTAARAGLRVGDWITAVDGLELNLDRALADVLWGYRAGDTMRLTVVRDGAARTIDLLLQPPPP